MASDASVAAPAWRRVRARVSTALLQAGLVVWAYGPLPHPSYGCGVWLLERADEEGRRIAVPGLLVDEVSNGEQEEASDA